MEQTKNLTLFLSWSGEPSGEIAAILKRWLKNVFSHLDVFLSGEDIEPGKRWSPELARQLECTDIGIFVYTKQNLNNLWMAFEAGALSKRVDASRVIPLLFGVHITDLQDIKSPLSQFQVRKWSQDQALAILQAINKWFDPSQQKDAEDITLKMEYSWETAENRVQKAMEKYPHTEHEKKRNIGESLDNLYSLMSDSLEKFYSTMRSSPLYSETLADEISQLLQQVKTTHAGSYLFIDGQDAAFSALIAATMRAKECIYSTRFFPMPITGNQDDYGRAIQSRVVGDKDGKISTLRRYTRIISANHPDKLKDIRKYLSDFLGANFTLYVTKRSNSFELVIIDSNEIFVHFYGAGQVINSTLHIVGKAVTAHFLSIYERLHSPKDDPDLLRIDFKHLKPSDVEDEDKKLQELFANSGSHPY